MVVTGRSIQEWSSPNPLAQTTASTASSLPSAKVTARAAAPVARALMLTPRRRSARRLVPTSASRAPIRRAEIRPVFVSHQKRSRPSSRWGRARCREPMERWTVCVSASSEAIWKPVLPPPTTSTVPAGTSPGPE